MLRSSDARRVIRLVASARDLPGSFGERVEHVLLGAAELVGAQVAGVVTLPRGSAMPRRPQDAREVGWPDPASARVIAEWRRDCARGEAPPLDPASVVITGLTGGAGAVRVTRRREDLVDDRAWYASPCYEGYRRLVGLDHTVYSLRSEAGSSRTSGVLFVRSSGDRPFTRREVELVDVLHAELPAILGPDGSEPAGRSAARLAREGLSPRLRQTLELLLLGRTEREIAGTLSLSPHTVHDYAKALYRRLGVRSRAELLRLCLAQG